MSECYVSAADYRRYWPTPKPYGGPERRMGITDRRYPGDRRGGPYPTRRWRATSDRRVLSVIGLTVQDTGAQPT